MESKFIKIPILIILSVLSSFYIGASLNYRDYSPYDDIDYSKNLKYKDYSTDGDYDDSSDGDYTDYKNLNYKDYVEPKEVELKELRKFNEDQEREERFSKSEAELKRRSEEYQRQIDEFRRSQSNRRGQ